MEITQARFNSDGKSITATIDGIEMTVPVDVKNRHFMAISESGINPDPHIPQEPSIPYKITRMQGQLALGEDRWSQVMSYYHTATWAEKVIIDASADWERDSQNIAFFQYLLDLTDADVDAMFVAAADIKA